MIITGTMFSNLANQLASQNEQKALDAKLTPHKAQLPKSEQEYNDYKSALLELFNAAKKLGISGDELPKSIDEISNDDIDRLLKDEYVSALFEGLDKSEPVTMTSYKDARSYGSYLAYSQGVKNISYHLSSQNLNDKEKLSIIDMMEQNLIAFGEHLSDESKDEYVRIFTREMSAGEFSKAYMSLKAKVDNEFFAYKSKMNEQNKADEIERNNRMLLRQYNGAKSRNLSLESKNEILKTFFEEFLKNNNPLALLEIMKKTDIRA